MLNKANNLLYELKQTPKMFSYSKEAFIMRVSTILEMYLEDFDPQEFYIKHLDKTGSAFINIHDDVSEEWSDAVINDAITYLQKDE